MQTLRYCREQHRHRTAQNVYASATPQERTICTAWNCTGLHSRGVGNPVPIASSQTLPKCCRYGSQRTILQEYLENYRNSWQYEPLKPTRDWIRSFKTCMLHIPFIRMAKNFSSRSAKLLNSAGICWNGWVNRSLYMGGNLWHQRLAAQVLHILTSSGIVSVNWSENTFPSRSTGCGHFLRNHCWWQHQHGNIETSTLNTFSSQTYVPLGPRDWAASCASVRLNNW